MAKNIDFVILLDIYGNMLTDRQRDVMELYYWEDLSLGEIAESNNITRQAVRDSIKRGEMTLAEFEKKLGLAVKIVKCREYFNAISDCACNMKKSGADKTDEIISLAGMGKEIF